MKHFFRNFLIINILCFSITTFAQTEKGSWMVGGNLGMSSGNNASYTLFNANLSPMGGYFFMKNLVIGAELPISYGSETVDLTVATASTFKYYQITNLGFSPFVRYYFGEKKLKPFVQANYYYNHFNEATTLADGSNNTNAGYAAYATAGIGLAYFVAPNVSLDAKLDYQFFRSNANYVFNKQPDFQVGFQIFLPKK